MAPTWSGTQVLLSGCYSTYGFLLLQSLHDPRCLLAGAVTLRSQSQPPGRRKGRGEEAHAHSLSGHLLAIPHLTVVHRPEPDYTATWLS